MVNYEDLSASAVVEASNVGNVKAGTVLTRNTAGEVLPASGTNLIAGIAYSEPINGIVAMVRFGIVRVEDDTTGTYSLDQPVKVSAADAGKVAPWVSGVDAPELIIGKVEVLPDANNIMEIRLGGV